ncbi:hypothetical protein F4Y93_11625 [Candidatus Poribacteria bacterium]|nr:hypothetical protein [Candidatus Poribacteria bacterium]
MENTVIIKEDGTSIDSKDCRSFHLNVIMTGKLVKRGSGDKPQSRTYPSTKELVAYTFEDKQECIATLRGITTRDSANALISLIEAIGREKVWDVREYISNI